MCCYCLPGCTLCERSYTSDCPEHGPVTFIPDTPIQSRARLSLPRPLCLRISVADEPLGKKMILCDWCTVLWSEILSEIHVWRKEPEFRISLNSINLSIEMVLEWLSGYFCFFWCNFVERLQMAHIPKIMYNLSKKIKSMNHNPRGRCWNCVILEKKNQWFVHCLPNNHANPAAPKGF